MKNITTLEDAFVHSLSTLFSAEQQLTNALPKMAKAASISQLADNFYNHLQEKHGQLYRIDRILAECNLKLENIICEIMKKLLQENNTIIQTMEKSPVRDVMLISNAQKIEHHEMAAYSLLIEMAKKLRLEEAADLLEESFTEERAASAKLAHIAVAEIHEKVRVSPQKTYTRREDISFAAFPF